MYGIQFSPKVNHARLACTKQKTSLPLRRAERSVCLSKDGASGLGKYLGHDLPAVRALLLGVEVHINGTCRRKVPEPVQGVQIPALIFVSANRGWGLSSCPFCSKGLCFPRVCCIMKAEIAGGDSHAGKALHNALWQDSLLGES